MEELWFVDTPVWTETTISQFLDVIEGNENWTDVDKKTFTLNHLLFRQLSILTRNVSAII